MRGKRVIGALSFALALGGGLGLVLFPRETAAAAFEGLALCAKAVIPSLFPFFVAANLLLALGPPAFLPALAGGWFERSFGVGRHCLPVFLLGAVGGYPVGAALACREYENGACGKEEAERLLIFCNNCGPAFIFGVLGGRVLGSAGWAAAVFAVHLAVSVWLGALLGAGRGHSAGQYAAHAAPGFPAAFSGAVKTALTSTLNVCAYVVLFAVPARFLPERALIRGFLELTGGILSLSGLRAETLAQAAFLLGWGGLGVLCQVLSVTTAAGLSARRYLVCRLLHGLASALLVWLLFTRPWLLPAAASCGILSVRFVKRGRNRKILAV